MQSHPKIRKGLFLSKSKKPNFLQKINFVLSLGHFVFHTGFFHSFDICQNIHRSQLFFT